MYDDRDDNGICGGVRANPADVKIEETWRERDREKNRRERE